MDAEEMPGMGVFHDFGKAIEYGNKQKSYRHRTPDSLTNSRQQTIRFDDNDRETADCEATEDEAAEDDISEALGFKPFDQEP